MRFLLYADMRYRIHNNSYSDDFSFIFIFLEMVFLNLSCSKLLKDLSIIGTPPSNRISIRTYVQKYEPVSFLTAIKNEIARDGQIFIENAIQGLDININGDGEDKLDFTYIEDLVRGISYCCDNEKAKNQVFNITFGGARKINDLINILKNKIDNKIEIKNI